jgi:hypothetical protein
VKMQFVLKSTVYLHRNRDLSVRDLVCIRDAFPRDLVFLYEENSPILLACFGYGAFHDQHWHGTEVLWIRLNLHSDNVIVYLLSKLLEGILSYHLCVHSLVLLTLKCHVNASQKILQNDSVLISSGKTFRRIRCASYICVHLMILCPPIVLGS